jgi:hypothetical protein
MSILRIRATSGDLACKWLWTIGVSKAGVTVQQPNWTAIVTGPASNLQFHPKFIDDKVGGFRPISREVGEAIVRILRSVGVESELVSEEPENPGWIDRERQAAAKAERGEDAASQRERAESHSISERGGHFWRTLVEHVENNARALESNYTRAIDEKIVGVVTARYDLTHTPEWSLHIQVTRHSVKVSPDSRQLNLYYRPGGLTIRRVYQLSKEDAVSLVPLPDHEVGVEVNGRPLTAKMFAEETIKTMLGKVNFPDAR